MSLGEIFSFVGPYPHHSLMVVKFGVQESTFCMRFAHLLVITNFS